MSSRPRLVALSAAEHERIAEARRAATLGAAGAEKLVGMLGDPSWTVRREVVTALGGIGAPALGPVARVLREQRDDETRLAAAVDAMVASTADVMEEVQRLAHDPSPAIAADAAQILGRRRSAEAVPLLAELVGHADDNVSLAAMEALGRIGGAGAVDRLIEAVRSGSFFRVFPAIDVLGRSRDPRAVAPLAELVANATYTPEAARALGRTGETAAVAPLAALLGHPVEAVIRVAAVALAELFERQRQRFGTRESADEALRAAHPGTAAIRRLVRALGSADAVEQSAISEVLGTLGGDEAISALTDLLDVPGEPAATAASSLHRLGRDTEPHVRAALREGNAARRLALLPVVTTVAAGADVAACLTDADPAVRALAAETLARVGAVHHVAVLFPLLADGNARVVQAAMGAIQSLGSAETKALALAAAADERPPVRRAALRVLAYFGWDESLPIFLAALEDPDPRARDAALGGLALLDAREAFDAVLGATRSADAKTRASAMRVISQSTRRDPRIAATLLQGLRDPDAWVRYYACQSLGKLGVETATASIVELLGDEAGQVRVAAVEALSHFSTAGALAALRDAATGAEPDVRRAALIGLGISRRPEAMPILVEATRAGDPATRLVAISALADTDSPSVLPAMARAASDPDENVRSAALSFIGATTGAAGTRVLIDLLAGATDGDAIVRLLALPHTGRTAVMLAALDTADDDLAAALTAALARMRTPESRVALIQAMASPSAASRKAAANVLASLRSGDALEALRHCAENDPDAQVRQICAVLLAQ